MTHSSEDPSQEKAERIALLEAIKRPHRVDVLVHGLRDEKTALRIEAAVIDLLSLKRLTNIVRGWGSVEHGRRTLTELVAHYSRQEVRIREPAILIRINQLYRSGMSPVELYDATRGVWRVGEQREAAKYAFALYDGVIREVYRITKWLPAGSTLSTRDPEDLRYPDRWEFVGTLADARLRKRYVNKAVQRHQFPQGAQNPIRYVNVPT